MSVEMQPQLHRDWIDPHAIRIVQVLQEAGFETYLVGGCVRDLLAGVHPKDFDIATSALPQQVKRKVPNSYVIGRRFKLVLAKRGNQQFEIATFRKNAPPTADSAEGDDDGVEGDNFFGTMEEDAQRRDFTINALFYDPLKNKLIDHIHGVPDVVDSSLRMIGDPVARLIEDPIRILRAIRLSQKLKFRLEPTLRAAILETAPSLKNSVLPRRREEWLKFLKLPFPLVAFFEMKDLGVLDAVFPALSQLFDDPEKTDVFCFYLNRTLGMLENKDTPGDLIAAFLLSYLKATQNERWGGIVHAEQDEEFQKMIRDELGVHKAEFISFQKGIEFVSSLKNTGAFLRRGPRRQEAFLGHDFFSAAMWLGIASYELGIAETSFWENRIKETAENRS